MPIVISNKKAYIANKARPKFQDSQMQRMEKFKNDTHYTLRIENRISIDWAMQNQTNDKPSNGPSKNASRVPTKRN
jgi:hypothetical protein